MDIGCRMLLDQDAQTAVRRLALRAAVSSITGGRLFFAGNGGSAATANHAAEDFRLNGRIDAYSLAANGPAVMAIANDYGYKRIFERQLKHYRAGRLDTVVLLSVSGRSKNIVRAVDYCLRNEVQCHLLTSQSAEIPDGIPAMLYDWRFPGDVGEVESAHLLFLHAVLRQTQQLMESIHKGGSI